MSSDKIEVNLFTDKAGQEVFRGDYIVYGQALGRSASLNFGKVVNIKSGSGYNNNTVWAITIIALDETFVWSDEDQIYKYGKTVMNKKPTLQFPERIVKFDNIPHDLKHILDTFDCRKETTL